MKTLILAALVSAMIMPGTRDVAAQTNNGTVGGTVGSTVGGTIGNPIGSTVGTTIPPVGPSDTIVQPPAAPRPQPQPDAAAWR